MCAPRHAAAVVRPRGRKKSADRRRRILISRLLIIRASVPRRKSPFPAYFKGFPAVSPLIPPYPAFLKYPVSPQKRYEKENAERKNHLQDLQTQRNKAEKDLLALKTEVLACIKGESVLPRETLAEMITAQEEKLTELENLCEAASEELEKTAELMDKVSRLYDELISYADLYDSANFEAKKMIVNQLIRRVDVYRGYQINISFNFDLTPYIEGE